eukprot:CAMPEP_0172439352 /NCGR_PEP_ID=MMETSP1065-20121228/368_1 /TAXON_ID=265537 /ORGANISM="Amphiprora paludosa, Strain CCMP125" /LENGTH=1263 /DNA_ID=CAMNT_0013188027 /DNA_START=246 /DNA_END=4037 /DNA_ORIENTATION=+
MTAALAFQGSKPLAPSLETYLETLSHSDPFDKKLQVGTEELQSLEVATQFDKPYNRNPYPIIPEGTSYVFGEPDAPVLVSTRLAESQRRKRKTEFAGTITSGDAAAQSKPTTKFVKFPNLFVTPSMSAPKREMISSTNNKNTVQGRARGSRRSEVVLQASSNGSGDEYPFTVDKTMRRTGQLYLEKDKTSAKFPEEKEKKPVGGSSKSPITSAKAFFASLGLQVEKEATNPSEWVVVNGRDGRALLGSGTTPPVKDGFMGDEESAYASIAHNTIDYSANSPSALSSSWMDFETGGDDEDDEADWQNQATGGDGNSNVNDKEAMEEPLVDVQSALERIAKNSGGPSAQPDGANMNQEENSNDEENNPTTSNHLSWIDMRGETPMPLSQSLSRNQNPESSTKADPVRSSNDEYERQRRMYTSLDPDWNGDPTSPIVKPIDKKRRQQQVRSSSLPGPVVGSGIVPPADNSAIKKAGVTKETNVDKKLPSTPTASVGVSKKIPEAPVSGNQENGGKSPSTPMPSSGVTNPTPETLGLGSPPKRNNASSFYDDYMKTRNLQTLGGKDRKERGSSPTPNYEDYKKARDAEARNSAAKSKYRNTISKPLFETAKWLEDEKRKQIEWVQKENEKLQEVMKEFGSEHKAFLKKQLRLAITGGVPLNRQVAGERPVPELDTTGMTRRIMDSISKKENEVTGSTTWEVFQKAEENWRTLREYMPAEADLPAPFVTDKRGEGSPSCYAKLQHQATRELDYDIVVCGGTLGIFFATALQLKGHKVCVVESGKLRGRDQEWNIGKDELMKLKDAGVVSQEDIDAAIQTEFAGCRSAFKTKEVEVEGGYADNGIGYECFTEGVLNTGVSPKILLERVASKFVLLGGVIKEDSTPEGITVVKNIGAAIDMGDDREPVTAHLVIDAMGQNSPITLQQRHRQKPDGISVVVGTCASGYDPKTNLVGDAVYTNSGIQDKKKNGKMQYFWESFPVGIGRNGNEPGSSDTKTAYMFTYMDAHERRPTLEALFEDYWKMLPQYQPSIENPERDLDVKRAVFAYFPTYKDSPLQPSFDRILAVGDASGIQSPLSFGGFGSLARHLDRVSEAVSEAIEGNLLTKDDLSEINPYTPNLSASWMFQKAMSVGMGQMFVDRRFVNRLLSTNLEAMNEMGPQTITPFLQDVVRFDGLVGTITKSAMADPLLVPQIVAKVGFPTLFDWMGHVSMMGVYSALDNYVSPWLKPIGETALRKQRPRYYMHRKMDAWKYGSGNDWNMSEEVKESAL